MSSILKALKKLEQEKVLRGERNVDLALDIHRGAQRANRLPLLPLVLLALSLVLFIGAGTFWWLQRSDNRRGRVTDQARETVSGTAAISPEPGSQQLAATSHATEEPAQSAAATPEPPAPATIAPPAAVVMTPPVSDTPVPASTPAAAKAVVSDPLAHLHLSGIVWQEDAAARMAIVNDLPVMVGTQVEGAKVVGIEPDRVILSKDGKRLELVLKP